MQPTVFVPRAQLTGGLGAFVIRAGEPVALERSVLAVVRDVDARVPAPELGSMNDVIGASVSAPRCRQSRRIAASANESAAPLTRR